MFVSADYIGFSPLAADRANFDQW